MSGYITRSIEATLNNMRKSFPVVMITGSRQVGKTTLLKIMRETADEKINYVSLDDLQARSLAVEDPELFLRKYKQPLIIDEFQYAPDLLSYIKMTVDEKRFENLRNNEVKSKVLYFLTGSQIFHTMKNISESLAGRTGILDLYGLTNREISKLEDHLFLPTLEILEKREKRDLFDVDALYKRIFKGSYPELYNNIEMSEKKYFETYVKTYIERDIRELINVKDEIKFLKFISCIAARTGQELNINDISNDVAINNNTTESWLSILTSTGIVYLLQPYFNNNISRIVKRPKIYFMDTGLASYLTGYVDSITLEKSVYNGAIFETFVVTEIIKSFANRGIDSRRHLHYLRDNNGKEIDLLIIYNNTIHPLEIKKSSNPDKSAIKHFNVVEKFGLNVGNGGVVCMKKDLLPIDGNNNYIPVELL